MSDKILDIEEFRSKNYDLCKFEHVSSWQTSCYECDGHPDKCRLIQNAYKQYKDSISNNDMLFEMMKAI